MKNLMSLFILALAVAITGPALAEVGSEAECTAVGGEWDADANECIRGGPDD